MMIPFLESFGGNCQDAVILSEVVAARVKPRGGCEGTVIEKLHMIIKKNDSIPNDKQCHYDRHLLIIFTQIIT